VIQPTDRTPTSAVTAATVRSLCCPWQMNEPTATTAAASMRKMGSAVYREPDSKFSATGLVVTPDLRVAPNAADRKPVIRAATTNTRACPRWVSRAHPKTTARIAPMISVAPFRPAKACSRQARCQPSAGSTTSCP
jgi:hypothetical protein